MLGFDSIVKVIGRVSLRRAGRVRRAGRAGRAGDADGKRTTYLGRVAGRAETSGCFGFILDFRLLCMSC